jgi:5'-nucleotidase
VAAHHGDAQEITPDLPEDVGAREIVARFGAPIAALRTRQVATAQAAMGNDTCRQRECAIGNVIAEAMLAAVPGADVALQNAGGIRAGLPAGTMCSPPCPSATRWRRR